MFTLDGDDEVVNEAEVERAEVDRAKVKRAEVNGAEVDGGKRDKTEKARMTSPINTDSRGFKQAKNRICKLRTCGLYGK